MIIDDEEAALLVLELMLESENYNIIKAQNNEIDLILLDLMMPDIYGIDLLRKVKNNPLTKNIPVIIQSGVANEKEKQNSIRLCAASFLSKPYSKKDLLDKINHIT